MFIRSIYKKVTICIVTHNRYELLKKCIDSVLSNTVYPYYEIMIYSNACSDGTVDYLKRIGEDDQISVYFSERNDVFVLPNIELMKSVTEGDVVLLNNDTEVTEGWLFGLVNAVEDNENVAVVGSKLLFVDGDLQEFGSELNTDGHGWNVGKGDDSDKEKYMGTKAVQYVSGCSMYLTREFINRGGVLDMDFHPCYFEDADLCFRAWKSDMKVMVTSDSVVYHHEGGTSGIDESTGFKKYQAINRKRFVTKYASSVAEVNKLVQIVNKDLIG